MATHKPSAETVSDLILFPFLFLWVWLWLDPSLNYNYPEAYRHVSVETYSSWFITDTPHYPGKAADRLASLLTPSFADAAHGGLVITLVAFILCWLLARILTNLGAQRFWIVKYAPAVLLLVEYYWMLNPLRVELEIIVGLALAFVYQVWKWGGRRVRPLVFLFLATCVFLGAQEAFIVFALACAVYECFVRRDFLGTGIVSAVAFCAPAATSPLFPAFTVRDLYAGMLPFLPTSVSPAEILAFAFWTAVPTLILFALFAHLLAKRLTVLKWETIQAVNASWMSVFRGALASVFTILAAGIILLAVRGAVSQARSDAAINAAMLTGDWDRVLHIAESVPKRRLFTTEVHVVDRALYFKGRLLSDLFLYPQSRLALLLFPYTRSANRVDRFWEMAWGGRTWFDLGLTNTAEHCVLESLAQCYCPQQLQLASQIYIVKRMPDAARTCLAALCKDRAYRSWAQAYLDSINADPTLVMSPQVAGARAAMLKEESVLTGVPPLSTLVRENPNNRMALEYLVAWDLIGRNLDSLVLHVNGFRALHYPALPLLFEEALLLYAALDNTQPDLCGYTLSSEAITDFEKFYTILNTKHGGRPDEAFPDLLESCGNSFYFYYVYGFSRASVPNDRK